MDVFDPLTLGLVAGALQIIGYILFVRLTKGTNAGSWLIWTLGAGVDAWTYFLMTSGELAKNALPLACALACLVTFIVMMASRRLGWPDATDWFFVICDGIITYIWLSGSMDVVDANLWLQVSTVFSFIPILRAQLRGKDWEHPLPWFIWTVAYGMLTATVWLDLSRWEELAYPASHAVLHFAVFLVALVKKPSS